MLNFLQIPVPAMSVTNLSYQQDEVENVQNPFEEEDTATVIISAVYIDGPHTRVTTHTVQL